jgi:hypothetical protein
MAPTPISSPGYGQDTIYDYDQGSGGNDTVRFAADILPAEVELSRNESDLFLKVLGTEDRITVSGFYSDPAQRIERIEFADGTVWTTSTLLAAKFVGTEADFITGTTGNDRMEGRVTTSSGMRRHPGRRLRQRPALWRYRQRHLSFRPRLRPGHHQRNLGHRHRPLRRRHHRGRCFRVAGRYPLLLRSHRLQ